MDIPEVLPGLVVLPKEYLAFDQAAVAVKLSIASMSSALSGSPTAAQQIAQQVLRIC